MSSQRPTPAQIIEKLKELSADDALDCMDETLIRIVRAAADEGSLSLGEIIEIITYEMCLDGGDGPGAGGE